MWHSLHGYIHNYQELDVYMGKEFLEFLNRNKIKFEQYFFIRYWLGGPHIRFRFKLKTNDKQNLISVKTEMEKSISNFLKSREIELVDKNQYYTDDMLKNEGITEVFWKPHGSVVYIEYEPEIERYKGEFGMKDTELLFQKSSELAEKINTLTFEKRIIISLNMMYWTMKIYRQDKYFLYYYKKMWENYSANNSIKQTKILTKAVKQILNNEAPPLFLVDYLEYLNVKVKICDENDYRVVYSHIHMFNNRIGIHPEMEFYLSSVLLEEMKGDNFEKK